MKCKHTYYLFKGQKSRDLTLLYSVASAKGFHPTNEPIQWYNVTLQDLLAQKVGDESMGVCLTFG